MINWVIECHIDFGCATYPRAMFLELQIFLIDGKSKNKVRKKLQNKTKCFEVMYL